VASFIEILSLSKEIPSDAK